MPEGAEVRVIADVLKQAEGLNLKKISVTKDKRYKFSRNGIEGADLIATDQIWTIKKVTTKGKLIYVHLNDDVTILNTLGMTGTWRRDSHGKHGRLRLDMTNGETYLYEDQRNFGTFKVVTRADAATKLKKIGWDLLRCPMPAKQWADLQQKKTIKNKPIGRVLMEQKHFSGIGNIYKAEILYRLLINPEATVGNLDPKTWARVNMGAHKILKTSYEMGGSSVSNYTADGKKGSFQDQLQIYKRKTCPKGHNTENISQNKRTTWYCPECQPSLSASNSLFNEISNL